MKNAVFTAFVNEDQVDKALHELRGAGFLPSQISCLFPGVQGQKSFSSDQITRVSKGAQWGAASGLILGAVAGLLAGSDEIQVPFLENVNPWLSSILGGIMGMLVGGGSGALVGIGTPAPAPDRYARYLDDGGIVLSVFADHKERADEAGGLLEDCGGADIAWVNEEDAWRMLFAHSRSFRNRAMPGRFRGKLATWAKGTA